MSSFRLFFVGPEPKSKVYEPITNFITPLVAKSSGNSCNWRRETRFYKEAFSLLLSRFEKIEIENNCKAKI